jgi:hypothetical protein
LRRTGRGRHLDLLLHGTAAPANSYNRSHYQ